MNGKKLRNHAKRKGMVQGVCVMKVGKVLPYTDLVATSAPPNPLSVIATEPFVYSMYCTVSLNAVSSNNPVDRGI